jgi:hypothetical protein
MTLVEKSQIVFFFAGGIFGFVFLLYLGFTNEEPDPDDEGYWTGFTVLWVCAVSFCGLGGLTVLYDTFMNKKDNVGVAPEIEQSAVEFKNLRY